MMPKVTKLCRPPASPSRHQTDSPLSRALSSTLILVQAPACRHLTQQISILTHMYSPLWPPLCLQACNLLRKLMKTFNVGSLRFSLPPHAAPTSPHNTRRNLHPAHQKFYCRVFSVQAMTLALLPLVITAATQAGRRVAGLLNAQCAAQPHQLQRVPAAATPALSTLRLPFL